jgi:superfamily II DNA helicase RecQ
MSATLTLAHMLDLQEVLYMNDLKVVNMGTDRPNLVLQVLPMRHGQSSFRILA